MLVKCKKCKCEFDLEDDLFITLFERKETLFCPPCLSWDTHDACRDCEHYKPLEFFDRKTFYCKLHPNYTKLYCKEKVIKK